jgi:N4-(beta-N-acetylglucosaminyl)-L-asparaginase
MSLPIDRRHFLTGAGAIGLAAAVPRALTAQGPTVMVPKTVRPVVISDKSGFDHKNGGPHTSIEKAFALIVGGSDVLEALIAGVNIAELDPEESGVGYGGMPNEEGVVQLDASCMHGPLKRAGAVAALEGVRTPSLVAKAVMDHTDHHLLVGKGAQDFARRLGFTVEDDLTTERSRRLWLEWKRRIDPSHYLNPSRRGAPDGGAVDGRGRADEGYRAARSMIRDGLVEDGKVWGTINCDAIGSNGDICGVTSTSGLSWKIPGRTGDSPILGAGLYVDNDVGAAGSTGRGEANLFNLTSFLIVEEMRRGRHPKDAGLEGLRRIRANTIEKRLLNGRGEPAFNIRFFALNKKGEYAGVAMYASGEATYGVCTENGAEARPLEPLLEGGPED